MFILLKSLKKHTTATTPYFGKDKLISVSHDKISHIEEETSDVIAVYMEDGSAFYVSGNLEQISKMINAMIGPIFFKTQEAIPV